jgi:hypothetical protein
MSSAPSVNDALTGYAAGRVTAEQLVGVVAAEYYRETRNGKRETWRPIIDVIERAHPGVVELTASEERPGFDVRLAERPFPKRYEAELRQAVETVLQTFPVSRVPFPEESTSKPGLVHRIVLAIRKLVSA